MKLGKCKICRDYAYLCSECGLCWGCCKCEEFEDEQLEQFNVADKKEAMYKSVILETIKEIEYWHADMLTEKERNHPRSNGWSRVYDNLKMALHA